jgi:hypothetical protein
MGLHLLLRCRRTFYVSSTILQKSSCCNSSVLRSTCIVHVNILRCITNDPSSRNVSLLRLSLLELSITLPLSIRRPTSASSANRNIIINIHITVISQCNVATSGSSSRDANRVRISCFLPATHSFCTPVSLLFLMASLILHFMDISSAYIKPLTDDFW